MFPNPQDALPLPLRPNLEQYKKLAKELLRAAKSTDSDAIPNWSTNWVKGLVEGAAISSDWKLWRDPDAWIRDVASFAQAKLSDGSKLSDAHFIIARSHGFPSWPKFVQHLRSASDIDSPEAQFDAMMHSALAPHALAQPQFRHQINRPLLKDSGANG